MKWKLFVIIININGLKWSEPDYHYSEDYWRLTKIFLPFFLSAKRLHTPKCVQASVVDYVLANEMWAKIPLSGLSHRNLPHEYFHTLIFHCLTWRQKRSYGIGHVERVSIITWGINTLFWYLLHIFFTAIYSTVTDKIKLDKPKAQLYIS